MLSAENATQRDKTEWPSRQAATRLERRADPSTSVY